MLDKTKYEVLKSRKIKNCLIELRNEYGVIRVVSYRDFGTDYATLRDMCECELMSDAERIFKHWCKNPR
jgi:hypothetical protein